MSYCRFGEGDVYLYGGADGWVCCNCHLSDECFADTVLPSLQEVKEHLEEHLDADHDVPDRAMQRVCRELAEHKIVRLLEFVTAQECDCAGHVVCFRCNVLEEVGAA